MRKLIFFLIFLIPTVTFSQQEREIKNLIISGDKAFTEKNYYGAAMLYEQALSINSKMYDVIYKAAEAYRLDNDYVRAAAKYKIIVDKVPEKYPESIFYYAQMLKSNEEFVSAQYYFGKYIEINKLASENPYLKVAEQEIINCELAWKSYNNPNGIIVYQADSSINTVYSEFSTAFLNDSVLLFSSIKPLNDTLKKYKSRLYSINLFSENRKAELLPEIINFPDYDIANPCFNSQGTKMYFTVSNYIENYTYIYEAIYENGEWKTPKKLPEKINYPEYHNTHPFLVERDNKTDILLWSSNRPDGEGGFDIWQCEILPDGTWGIVRNIGRPIIEATRFVSFMDTSSTINTSGNEITPFYDLKDSTLYFSSNRFNTIGGYDIFSTKGFFYKWGEVKNVGFPLNTAQNDFYYRKFQKQGIAFFSSNRKSSFAERQKSCCNDIYFHYIEKEITQEDIKEQKIELLTTKTRLLVPIALYFHNDIPNPNSWDTVTQLTYSQTFNDYIKMTDEYHKQFSKGLPKAEKQAAIDSIDYFFAEYVEANYNKLLEFSALIKELVLSGQKIKVTIRGYTSPLNTVEYNNNLAKRRISSLVNFFNEYDNGFFIEYIQNGQIEYEFVAFGKTFSAGKVSDDPNDPRNSIYSPAASRERRIEIIAVSFEKVEQNED